MKKKSIQLWSAAAFVALSLASCGPKLMTDEEMAKKVSDATNAKTQTLAAQLDKECETMMEARVASKADSIVTARKAEMEAAKPSKGGFKVIKK